VRAREQFNDLDWLDTAKLIALVGLSRITFAGREGA